MDHINHVLFLALKACQNPNLGDVQLRTANTPCRQTSPTSKIGKTLDTDFNIQATGCYSFQGSYLVCLAFSSIGGISLTN